MIKLFPGRNLRRALTALCLSAISGYTLPSLLPDWAQPIVVVLLVLFGWLLGYASLWYLLERDDAATVADQDAVAMHLVFATIFGSIIAAGEVYLRGYPVTGIAFTVGWISCTLAAHYLSARARAVTHPD